MLQWNSNITAYERVFVAFVIQHTMPMDIMSPVTLRALQYFPTYLINGTIKKNIKCVLISSTTSDTFLILKRNEWHQKYILVFVYRHYCQILRNFNFLDKAQISLFKKIRPGAELFHAGGRTWLNYVVFRNSVNVPKNRSSSCTPSRQMSKHDGRKLTSFHSILDGWASSCDSMNIFLATQVQLQCKTFRS
jgi:hypothetical protein